MTLILKSIHSDSKHYKTHLKNPESILGNQWKYVKNKIREKLLTPKKRGNKTIGIPFIIKYHPHLKYLGK